MCWFQEIVVAELLVSYSPSQNHTLSATFSKKWRDFDKMEDKVPKSEAFGTTSSYLAVGASSQGENKL
jgi:hypothetical protein